MHSAWKHSLILLRSNRILVDYQQGRYVYCSRCLLHYLPVTSNNLSRQSPFLRSGFVILAVGSISLLFSISSILVAHVSPFDPSGLSESVFGFAHISSRVASSSSSNSDTSFWSSSPSSLCSVENWKRKGKRPCASPLQRRSLVQIGENACMGRTYVGRFGISRQAS